MASEHLRAKIGVVLRKTADRLEFGIQREASPPFLSRGQRSIHSGESPPYAPSKIQETVSSVFNVTKEKVESRVKLAGQAAVDRVVDNAQARLVSTLKAEIPRYLQTTLKHPLVRTAAVIAFENGLNYLSKDKPAPIQKFIKGARTGLRLAEAMGLATDGSYDSRSKFERRVMLFTATLLTTNALFDVVRVFKDSKKSTPPSHQTLS
jgi:hypothetical protein